MPLHPSYQHQPPPPPPSPPHPTNTNPPSYQHQPPFPPPILLAPTSPPPPSYQHQPPPHPTNIYLPHLSYQHLTLSRPKDTTTILHPSHQPLFSYQRKHTTLSMHPPTRSFARSTSLQKLPCSSSSSMLLLRVPEVRVEKALLICEKALVVLRTLPAAEEALLLGPTLCDRWPVEKGGWFRIRMCYS